MHELEFKYFAGKQGSGYILPAQEFPEALNAEPLTVGTETPLPGGETTVAGFFCRPLIYLGWRDRHEMIFYMGQSDDGLHYFQSVFWISPTRIYEQFHAMHGRDFNFVHGVWK